MANANWEAVTPNLALQQTAGHSWLLTLGSLGPAAAELVRSAAEGFGVAKVREVRPEAMARRVGAEPVWLSTAGAGMSWLHVRLDDHPKYYGFAPYRQKHAEAGAAADGGGM